MLEPDEEPDTYIGKWQLVNVRSKEADSIESRQILELFEDSTYHSTFDITTENTHDTSGFKIPFTGKWEIYKWFSTDYIATHKQFGVKFYSDSLSKEWEIISGGKLERNMYFSFKIPDGAPTGYYENTFRLQWRLKNK
ncbi:MAG: hypothetical protein H3C35_12935 [Bacteroidetes bacterium]|nr:hypothetical protein [Bacteroidota bacterium]